MRIITSIWLILLFAQYINGQVHIKPPENPPFISSEKAVNPDDKKKPQPVDYFTILRARLDKFEEARDFQL